MHAQWSVCLKLVTICLLTFVLNSLSFSKNHGRQLESLQASLETEVKAKSDLVGIALLILT